MKYNCVTFIMGIVTLNYMAQTEYCGCKYTRLCYKKMLDELLVDDEEPCVENANIGVSTVTIFLQALRKYCFWCIYFDDSRTTFEGRNLYEVIINSTSLNDKDPDNIPVVVIDAGQDAGVGPVAFALYIIEQLVACGENKEMIRNVKWVILPSTNPDGLEFSEPDKHWQKNFSPNKNISTGVDITRNFDVAWDICPKNDNVFSQNYPGPKASSEKETNFIEDVLKKYKNNIKTYISLRRDGHAILYPYASSNFSLMSIVKVKKRASDVAGKVNQRAGGIQWFVNESIFNMNGKAYCGHSVEYAINNLNIPYAYEMRVFAESSNNIMSKFYSLPKGQEASLRAGYFSGIREIYKSIMNEMKQKPKK